MMKVKKRLLSLALAITCCTTILAVPVGAYNRSAVIQYADTYALARNGNVYKSYLSNCTNYVSQCMYAGGVPMDSVWWYSWSERLRSSDTNSNAWSVADNLKNYMKNNLGATRMVSCWRRYGNAQKKIYGYKDVPNSSNITNTGIEILFYDWDSDGTMNHSSIVVATGISSDGTGTGDLIDQNSKNRKHTIWHLDTYNDNRNKTSIYGFRL